MIQNHSQHYLDEVKQIAGRLDADKIEKLAGALRKARDQDGRLFILGVGGSAANASHAVNDFRKIAGFECYTPVDNVSELTARTNDEGWESIFSEWLKTSRLCTKDAVLILSVGGGSPDKKISLNLVRALDYARETGAGVFGIVGRDGGHTAKLADISIVIPTVRPETVTVHTEAFQSVLLHLLVSHPLLQMSPMKWESVSK